MKTLLCLACLAVFFVAACESAAIPDVVTPTTAPVTPTAPATAKPAMTPSRIPSPPPTAPSDLPLAYSTADGIFLWYPRTGERKWIAGAPAARLSWGIDGAWLATTDSNPFTAIQVCITEPGVTAGCHHAQSNFTFPVWVSDAVLTLPCPGTSGRRGDFEMFATGPGPFRTATNAEIWPWLPNVAPDLSKALITPFNAPWTPSAVILFDDWRAPLLLESVHFPSCPDAYAWSPDSRYLAYYNGGQFWVLDLDDLNYLGKVISGPATLEPINVVAPALAWSPDGKQLALALKGQVWKADLATLSARPIDGLTGVFSGLSWAPTTRRSPAVPSGVLSELMPYLNPADFYDAFVQVEGRPAPRIIAASTDILGKGPFVYLDYGQRKLLIAPPPTRLKCPPLNYERPQAPALRQSSASDGSGGRETIVVSGGWYMAGCQGTLVYRWDGRQLQLVVETGAAP